MTLAILPTATQSLDLDPWVWWVTIGVAAALLAFDVVWIARNPHRPSNRETGLALGGYVGAAILFGLGMWYFAGAQLAGGLCRLADRVLAVGRQPVHLHADHGEVRGAREAPAVRR